MFSLEIIEQSTPLDHGNVEFLKNYRFPNGSPFPKSYQDFALQYGYGLTMNLFMIYLPMDDYGDSWNVRSEEIICTYIEDIRSNKEPRFKLEPDGSMELLKTWIPFGSSENGHYLFWDIREEKNNEFDIYITDFRGLGIRKAANNLYEFIEKLTDVNRFKEVLPSRTRVFEPTFQPWIKE